MLALLGMICYSYNVTINNNIGDSAMTSQYESVKAVTDYNDYVSKEIFPYIEGLKMIIRFNEEMESYKSEWSSSQFAKTEEIE